MLFQIVPFKALASSFTRNDGTIMTGNTGGGQPDTAGGFNIVDSFYGSALKDPDFGTPMHIDTKFGGGYGTGLTGGTAGGWTIFNGPGNDAEI